MILLALSDSYLEGGREGRRGGGEGVVTGYLLQWDES